MLTCLRTYALRVQTGPICDILHRWTNSEKLVEIWKYNLYFYSSKATIVCSRNTVRESSHISFLCCGNSFCEVVRRLENTQEELTGLLEWPAGHSLDWETSGSSPSLERSVDICLQSKITDLILSFQVPFGSMNILFISRIFLFMGGYWNLNTSSFFPGNLLILSANGNICHSVHRQ